MPDTNQELLDELAGARERIVKLENDRVDVDALRAELGRRKQDDAAGRERHRQAAGLVERCTCTCDGEEWTCPRCAALELLTSG